MNAGIFLKGTVKAVAKYRTSKTDAVLRMLMGGSASNPIIDERFKEKVILSKRASGDVKGHTYDEGRIDVTRELVAEILPLAIKRFNCCRCDACFAEMLTDALDAAPEVAVYVKSDDDVKRVELLKKQNRRLILGIVVRIVIKQRRKGKH